MVKNILKGVVIGLANVIPGVSGGTMMVSMGIYDKLIHCITHLFSEFKKSVLFLLPIFIGIGIAVVVVPFGIEFLFAEYPFETNLLFVGLIVGGLPAVWKNVKGKSIKIGHLLACIAFFAVVAGLALMGEKEGNAADLSFSFLSVIKLFGVGIVASATMVIPGVSGSMMLLLMGYYHPILESITDFISAVFAFDMAGIMHGMGILIPFGIGVVAGIFAIAKLVEIIFEKFPMYAYWAIIGLILSSPVAIFLMGGVGSITVLSVAVGAAALAVGFVVALKLGE
jgi:Predicted membrane protein